MNSRQHTLKTCHEILVAHARIRRDVLSAYFRFDHEILDFLFRIGHDILCVHFRVNGAILRILFRNWHHIPGVCAFSSGHDMLRWHFRIDDAILGILFRSCHDMLGVCILDEVMTSVSLFLWLHRLLPVFVEEVMKDCTSLVMFVNVVILAGDAL